MPSDYYEHFRSNLGISNNVDHLGWIDTVYLEPETKIEQKKDTEYCYICSKKHGKRIYKIESAYNGKKKVCSNCKFLYTTLKKEIIDNNNNGTLIYICNTLRSIKTTMDLEK